MAFRCPNCTTDLITIANRTGNAAICGTCGGTWLDNVSSRAVVQNLLDQAVKYAARQGDARAMERTSPKSPYRQVPKRPEGERTCAECSAPLATTRIAEANLVIDVCSRHGTWFDAGELWAMAQHFEMKAALDDADASAFGKEIAAMRRQDAVADLHAAAMVFRILGR